MGDWQASAPWFVVIIVYARHAGNICSSSICGSLTVPCLGFCYENKWARAESLARDFPNLQNEYTRCSRQMPFNMCTLITDQIDIQLNLGFHIFDQQFISQY